MLASCEQELPYQVVTPIDTPAEVSLYIDGVGEEIGLMAPKTKSYTMMIKANSVADDMLKFTIGVDPAKVQEYNAANNTDYELVPGDAYTISKNEFILPRYNTISSTATITLKASGMPDDGVTRLLPVTITKIEGTPETAMEPKDSTVFIKFFRKSLAGVKFEEGAGTEADPYIIRDHADMLAMINDLKSGETTYVKMEADVDLTELEEWMPVNATEPYDKAVDFNGNGHVIKNLYSNAASMPSIFGVLTGKVYDVTIENATIEPGKSQEGTGVLAGKAVNAEIRNVTVKGLTVNSVGGNNNNGKNAGGLVGIADNCTFKNVNVNVNFVDADTDGKMPRAMGGMVGVFEGGASAVDNCHVKGTLFGHHYVGGLAGVVDVDGMEITNSSADVKMQTLGNFGGGFIGYVNKGFKATGCSSKGTISHSGNYHGGFIGVCQGEVEIRQCHASVDMTNVKGTHVGAFIGNLGKGTGDYNDNTNLGNSLVEDCYATGTITVTQGSANNGRMNAGFVSMVENVTGVTIRRCYASGDVYGNANGPIASLVAAAKNVKFLEEDIAFTMENCIAWSKVVKANPAVATCYSSAAVIGCSNLKNTLINNYRRADMEFTDVFGDKVYTLFDQENTSPSSPLVAVDGPNNKAPYHGKAAPKGSTCSDVAKMLGWPENIWDLSGDMPVLK